MKLTLKSQVIYGRKVFYPSCPLSLAICELLGQKSLTWANLETLKKHGVEMAYVEERNN
jgi:hypothetical protein